MKFLRSLLSVMCIFISSTTILKAMDELTPLLGNLSINSQDLPVVHGLCPLLMKTINNNPIFLSGNWITSVALSANGTFAVVCTAFHDTQVINLVEGTTTVLKAKKLMKFYALTSAISPDGKYVALATCSDLFIFDTTTQKCIWTHTSKARVTSIAIENIKVNNAIIPTVIILSGNKMSTLKRLSLVTGECLQHQKIQNTYAALSATGKFCVNINRNQQQACMVKFNLETRKLEEFPFAYQDNATSFAISATGKILAVGNKNDNLVTIYDLEAQKRFCLTKKSEGATIFSVAISADEKFLIAGSSDGTVKIWDLAWHQNLSSAQLTLIIKKIISLQKKKDFSKSDTEKEIWKTIPEYIKNNIHMLAQYGEKSSSSSYLML